MGSYSRWALLWFLTSVGVVSGRSASLLAPERRRVKLPARSRRLSATPPAAKSRRLGAAAALRCRGGGLVGLSGRLSETTRRLATGRLGPLAFVAVYVAVETCGIPSTALAALSGTLYTAPVAVSLVMLSSTTSALLAFYVGRHWLRGWVQESLLNKDPKLRAVDRAVAHHGFRVMLLLRLVPMPPLINYVYGASSAKVSAYLAATVIGYLPGTLACVLSTGMFANTSTTPLPLQTKIALAAVGLAALSVFTALAARSIKDTLAEFANDPQEH